MVGSLPTFIDIVRWRITLLSLQVQFDLPFAWVSLSPVPKQRGERSHRPV